MDASYRKLLSTTNATPLSDLTLHTSCIVYGIVTAFKPPRKTNGTDYMCHIHISDPTDPQGLSINIFQTPENLPEVQHGHVVECAIKVQMYASKLQGLSLKGTDYRFQIIDNGIALFLREWWSNSAAAVGIVPHPYTRPVLEVGGLKDVDTFCDLYAQVVHVVEPGQQDQPLELVVTDYTKNPNINFPIQTIPYTSLGPTMLLLVTLWDQDPMLDPPLQKNTYIHLRNLRIVSRHNGIQVIAHGDKTRTTTSHITIVNDGDEIDRIREREQKYNVMHGEDDVFDTIGPISRIPNTPMTKREISTTPIKQLDKTHPHTLRVKVMDHLPLDVRQFTVYEHKWVWRFSMLVTDGTGFMHVFVHGPRIDLLGPAMRLDGLTVNGVVERCGVGREVLCRVVWDEGWKVVG
ncbi:hypothetical protein SpCBS45565_g00425 [Spizellomyces sp. 'palustris']|nr:hypothetical protein SpCBS45565_g00425 [Spizellomyces sp. 'palustris']